MTYEEELRASIRDHLRETGVKEEWIAYHEEFLFDAHVFAANDYDENPEVVRHLTHKHCLTQHDLDKFFSLVKSIRAAAETSTL